VTVPVALAGGRRGLGVALLERLALLPLPEVVLPAPAGRSSSNHSNPSADSTIPARSEKRRSSASRMSAGTLSTLIFTTDNGSPLFPLQR
jgi:hypothetical protein